MKLSMLALVIGTVGFFAFSPMQTGSVKGTVTPAEGGLRAWAISSTDTFRTDISNGSFEIRNAKAGTYRIIIETNKPYKNVAKEDVVVADGTPTDIGTIKLLRDSIGEKL